VGFFPFEGKRMEGWEKGGWRGLAKIGKQQQHVEKKWHLLFQCISTCEK